MSTKMKLHQPDVVITSGVSLETATVQVNFRNLDLNDLREALKPLGFDLVRSQPIAWHVLTQATPDLYADVSIVIKPVKKKAAADESA